VNENGVDTTARVTLNEQAKGRPIGPFEFGPWHLNITPEQLSHSTAYVRHQCHWGYETVSKFYWSD